MATDTDAQLITINYTGGSLTMPIGNAKDLFGEDNGLLRPPGEEITASVKSHSRTRVIGQPSSTVSAHNREYIQWPTSQANNAAAGKPVLMSWEGSDGTWTARVSGTMSKLGTFLNAAAAKTVRFRTMRGTKYGPFAQDDQ